MLFNSFPFLVFLPVVVLAYFLLPQRFRNFWLLVASYYFYMCWNAKYVVLLLFSTLLTYVCAILIENIHKSGQRKGKAVLAVCVLGNLGVLFYFKYMNFFLRTLTKLFAAAHIQLTFPAFDILLPVGISFFTFQTLGYVIDVYRGDTKAEKKLIQYALFVSFFPQLVAGPIERSKNLLHQLKRPGRFCLEDAKEGLLLMLWGFFLKIVLADRIALFVDVVYGDIEAYPGMYLIVATVLFAFQIYCDFYGYSAIAKGAAKTLQIDLMDNFKAPYLSENIKEFWRNWHISLTSWLTDYLYIPLGGNRGGIVRASFNRLAVFFASGLWHGAGLSFIVWGILNGIFQILSDLLKGFRDSCVRILRIDRSQIGFRIVRILLTFCLVDFTWIFFRAASLGQACQALYSMIHVHNPWILFDESLFGCGLERADFMLLVIGIAILFFADLYRKRSIRIRDIILSQHIILRIVIWVFAIMSILIFGIYGPSYLAANFIYFQF